MTTGRRKPRPVLLGAMVVVSAVYITVVGSLGGALGIPKIEGVVGVVLGLYICSLPAANLVDMLFYSRVFGPPFASRRKIAAWVALNSLTLIAGLVVIVLGATRFTAS